MFKLGKQAAPREIESPFQQTCADGCAVYLKPLTEHQSVQGIHLGNIH